MREQQEPRGRKGLERLRQMPGKIEAQDAALCFIES